MPISYETASSLLGTLIDTRELELACDEFLMQSSLFAMVELSGSNARTLPASSEFAHHLSICGECREEFESLNQILQSMSL